MKCAIVGGGASGLVAAIFALRKGVEVTIYEKNVKVGRKILATGNGRCNVTNEHMDISRYHGEDKGFIKSILNRFDRESCKSFFNHLGLQFYKKDNGRYYPLSLQSSSVVDVLVHRIKHLGGVIQTQSFVKKIEKKDKFLVVVDDKTYSYDRVLIATGSNAMPKLGSSQSGYGFAKGFGHKINPTFASLVQIECQEDNSVASGVKFSGEVKVMVENIQKKSAFDDILITKYGLSGSAILDISRSVGEEILNGKRVEVFVDCLNSFSRQHLSKMFFSDTKKSPDKPIILLLNGYINKKLALLVLNRCHISPQKTGLSKKEINSIAYKLKNLNFTPTKTKGEDFAEVVAGGISTKDVDKNTLQSKLTKGLYFSGEVLDVDGDCGGFNLHWAWASGFVVGNSL